MTFRTRLLIAFGVAAIVPIVILAIGVRREVSDRLSAQYRARLQAQISVAAQDIARESDLIARRLAAIRDALGNDDRFRLAAVRSVQSERGYLLDYATGAMNTAGLGMLQIQDGNGRIVSSGHFRNEFDRLEPELPPLIASAGAAGALVRARSPHGDFVALARVDSLVVGARRFHLTGGVAIDDRFLSRIQRGDDQRVWLLLEPGSAPVREPLVNHLVDSLPLQFAGATDGGGLSAAYVMIAQPLDDLLRMQRDLNAWFAASLALVVLTAGGLAVWLSRRLSRPLADLAAATTRIDLDGTQVAFAVDRGDEIGMLARRLAALTTRIRSSAVRLRDAERRVTIGDMARQVNHDIRNGLIPIRNVLRHLGAVQSEDPSQLPAVFGDRRGTLDSSIEYLDTLARNYARLTPRATQARIDVNSVVRDAANAASMGSASSDPGSPGAEVQTRLAPTLPPIAGDPIVLRRIVDNLLRNAIESLDNKEGRVTVTTQRGANQTVVVRVADTGHGMTEQELARAFEDFFTTKESGTGLGLSVVRRLTTDLFGTVRVETAPGRGTTFTLEFPALTATATSTGRG